MILGKFYVCMLGWERTNHCNKQYNTVDSRYYDFCYNEILLITIPNLYPNHSKTIEIQTGYIDILVILVHFPYPISIVITRVYCSVKSEVPVTRESRVLLFLQCMILREVIIEQHRFLWSGVYNGCSILLPLLWI